MSLLMNENGVSRKILAAMQENWKWHHSTNSVHTCGGLVSIHTFPFSLSCRLDCGCTGQLPGVNVQLCECEQGGPAHSQ